MFFCLLCLVRCAFSSIYMMKEEFLGYGCTINLLVHFILMFLSVHSGHSVLVLRTHINGLRIFIRLSALMTFWDISFLVVAFLNHFILYYVDLGRELLTGLFESNVNKSYFLHCSFKLPTNWLYFLSHCQHGTTDACILSHCSY